MRENSDEKMTAASSTQGDKKSVSRKRAIRKPAQVAGPLGELKALLYTLYADAGSPSLDEITERIRADDLLDDAPGRDTVRRILSSPTLPPRCKAAEVVAIVLARIGGADEDGIAKRVRDLWVKSLTIATDSPGVPVSSLNPLQLNVHPVIDSKKTGRSATNSSLPTYVPRDHDAYLRELVKEAISGSSRVAILVGSSSCGKTRSCWEAIRELPDPWRVWRPGDYVDVGDLVDVVDEIQGHTVVWIDNAHNYLSNIKNGEEFARRLLKALDEQVRAPILILGTMWSEHWEKLANESSTPAGTEEAVYVRRLLSGRGIEVPRRFEGADMDRMLAAAEEDEQLLYATERAAEGEVAQFLAGAPRLIDRYRFAPHTAKAIVEAAMDLRRLGHGLALDELLLQGAAGGYLSDVDWDLVQNDWWCSAIEYVTKPVSGTRGLLSRIRPRPGVEDSGRVSYRLADYIDFYGRENRRVAPPSRASKVFWHALLGHADVNMEIVRSACNRGLLKIAVQLCQREAANGGLEAARGAADMLRALDRLEEALIWYERAYQIAVQVEDDREKVNIQWVVVNLLAREGRIDEAVEWMERNRCSEYDGAFARADFFCGEFDSGMARLADAEIYSDIREMVRELKKNGNLEEALSSLIDHREDGGPDVLVWEAIVLSELGRTDQALDVLRRAANEWDAATLHLCILVLNSAGRSEDADTLMAYGWSPDGAIEEAWSVLPD